ncbi:hypothetical protein BC831DRAFT_156076 [Entophlyctis helioformis]|nr:hypothetical protein BC831DRAFT_156076 [Entophlyctis helioformis]
MAADMHMNMHMLTADRDSIALVPLHKGDGWFKVLPAPGTDTDAVLSLSLDGRCDSVSIPTDQHDVPCTSGQIMNNIQSLLKAYEPLDAQRTDLQKQTKSLAKALSALDKPRALLERLRKLSLQRSSPSDPPVFTCLLEPAAIGGRPCVVASVTLRTTLVFDAGWIMSMAFEPTTAESGMTSRSVVSVPLHALYEGIPWTWTAGLPTLSLPMTVVLSLGYAPSDASVPLSIPAGQATSTPLHQSRFDMFAFVMPAIDGPQPQPHAAHQAHRMSIQTGPAGLDADPADTPPHAFDAEATHRPARLQPVTSSVDLLLPVMAGMTADEMYPSILIALLDSLVVHERLDESGDRLAKRLLWDATHAVFWLPPFEHRCSVRLTCQSGEASAHELRIQITVECAHADTAHCVASLLQKAATLFFDARVADGQSVVT